ncbi:alpha-2-macroglobulin family protein [Oceanidesulfovibrio indonesiensis]|nr:alpha-2-macroglobulin [Oceanidesulfovibrio indonesiensis]
MSDENGRNVKELGKNFLIVVLVMVVAVQAALLFSQSRSEFMEKGPDAFRNNETAADAPASVATDGQVAVEEAVLDSARGAFALVAFNQPVVEKSAVGTRPAKEPAEFSPRIRGDWEWVSPFMLRFDADGRFDRNKSYTLSLLPENILGQGREIAGADNITLKMQEFEVDSIDLRTVPARGKPGSVQIKGKVEFSLDVLPEDFLEHVRLKDPNAENGTVPLLLERYYQSREIYFISDPEAPIKKELDPRQLELVIDASLPAANTDYTLSTPASQGLTIVFDPALTVKRVRGSVTPDSGTVTLELSSGVDARKAEDFVTVDPQVKYTAGTDGNDLLLTGNFAPGSTYTIHVAKGMPALDGAAVQEARSLNVRIPDLAPSVAFDDTGVFLSRHGLRNVAFTSVNTKGVDLKIDRVYRNNVFHLLADYSSGILLEDSRSAHMLNYYLGDRVVEKEIALDTAWNEPQQFVLNTDEVFPDEPGLYRMMLSEPNNWQASQRFVLVTDLGIVAKRGVDDLLVWIASYENLEVQPGVSVKVLSYQNQTLAEGTTDENGLVHFTDMADTLQKHTPFLIYAEQGDDMSFLVFNQFGIDTTGLNVGGVEPTTAGFMGYVYGERDIYRPGEVVEGAAILRQADMSTPPSIPLTLKWIDPRGRELDTLFLEMNEEGMASYAFDVPAYALTGSHTLELVVAEEVVASYEFKVEEFLPDRIKVDLETTQGEPKPGSEYAYTVQSRYFFGPPASDLAVESRVQLLPASFDPEGFEAYVFGDPDRSFDDMELTADEGVLDADGTAAFTFSVPEGLTPPAALAARIVARVSERGGRGVSVMKQIPAHAYPRYPGIRRLARKGVDPGSDVTFEYVVLSPEGEKTSGEGLVAELYENHWQTVLRRTPSGSFRYHSERDSNLIRTMQLDDSSEGSFIMTPPQYGSYSVVLRDASGASSRVDFYAGGWGYSPWAVENAATIDLAPDKAEYGPGDTASVQVRAPFSGRLLVTVEGGSVHHVASYTMDGNTAQVDFPIKEEYGPNVYVTAVLVRPAGATEPGMVSRAFGAAPVFVNRTANRTSVSINAPETVRPKTSLEVAVQTEPGAMVTLSAVDEGILSLIDQESPDPFPHFYAKRRLQVESYDTFAMLFPEVEGVSPVGGGALGKEISKFVSTDSLRRVKPVAFWFEPVQADADGLATFALDLPEFQGAVRFMAVSVKGKRLGAADAQTKVRSPLVVTPTLPRFMAVDDEIRVPVAIRNDTPGDGVFTVSFNVSGPGETERSEVDIAIPQGQEKLAVFTLRATGDGVISCSFTASGNEETMAVNVELPVRPALPPRTIVESGMVSDARQTFPDVDEEAFRSEGLVREVYLGPSPMVRFTRSLKYLLRYPYGCVEQTTSSAFPLLYVGDVAATLDPDLDTRGVPSMVQAGIQRLQAMQLDNGGFAMWSGGRDAYDFGSFYATHFLVEALEAGYADARFGLDSALGYVAGEVRKQLDNSDRNLRQLCYAIYVLALAGQPDKGSMDHVRSYYGSQLDSLSGALLGAAYALTGDMEALEQLMEGHWGSMQEKDTPYETGGFLSSSLRDDALRLAVLQRQIPGDPRIAELVQELVRKLEAEQYISTQKTAWAMIALGQFYRNIADNPPFSGTLLADGEEIARFSSDSTLALTGELAIKGARTLEILMDEGFESGALFYTVRTIGIPEDATYEPYEQGLTVKRTFYNREGEHTDLEDVKQGDLVVLELDITSKVGRVSNVAMLNMLPAGLEVENPRLESTESLPWLDEKSDDTDYVDLRDDRVIFFLDLSERESQTVYVLLRAVTAGDFMLPPVLAEAMYDPQIAASTELGTMSVASGLMADGVAKEHDQGVHPSENSGNSTKDVVGVTEEDSMNAM